MFTEGVEAEHLLYFYGRNTGNNERSVGVFGAVRCPYYGELLITEDHLHPL